MWLVMYMYSTEVSVLPIAAWWRRPGPGDDAAIKGRSEVREREAAAAISLRVRQPQPLACLDHPHT